MIFILLYISQMVVNAQSTTIREITSTALNPWRTDLYVYASWSMNKHGNLLQNDINAAFHGSELYMGLYEVGIRTDYKKDKGLFLEGSLGYMFGSLAYFRSPFETPNVRSHWITFDLNASLTKIMDGLFFIGVKSDVFLNSSNNRAADYAILGIYDDCFNPATLFPYLGVRMSIRNIRLDGRIGYQVVQYLNPNKVACHTMTKSAVSPLYFEVGIGLRLFTNSNKSKTVEYIKNN